MTYNEMFWDAVEELPGCFMIQREIKKAITGQPFFFNDGDTGKPVQCEAVQEYEMKYYLDIWDNFHHFGLPHATGWSSERQWLLNFLKMFENAFKSVQYYNEQQAYKRVRLESGNGGNFSQD